MSFSSPLDARQFLVNKIVAQSVRTGDRLSDVDRRMLLLNLDEPQSAAGIPVAVLEDTGRTYENRIIGLLKSAYERDRDYPEERQRYREALDRLVGSKHYILMIASGALRSQNEISSVAIYVIIGLVTAGIILLLLWPRSK
ncbi:MAG TPA: hypothetical protein VI488_10540 [Candidatus Angelobacter sp.]